MKTTESEAGPSDADIESALAVEIGTRIHTVFQLILAGYQCPNGDTTGMGGGFRIDIPGFFWMGGPKQLGVRRRFYPVNTSLFGTFIQDTIKNESGTTDKAMGTNMGFTIDVFLFNRYVFLKGEASIKTVLGNSYLATGGGLGVEF